VGHSAWGLGCGPRWWANLAGYCYHLMVGGTPRTGGEARSWPGFVSPVSPFYGSLGVGAGAPLNSSLTPGRNRMTRDAIPTMPLANMHAMHDTAEVATQNQK